MTIAKPYAGDSLHNFEEVDFLILMGGPQSPLAIPDAPYLKDEIELVRKYLSKDKPVLGFCLGAQLIGEAFGAKTERSPEKEVGVYPISFVDDASTDPLLKMFPKKFDVIHWHNDMPGLTNQSVVLAESEGCPRQIVRYKKQVYGFQCHLEVTTEGIETMINACPRDLDPSRFTQSEAELVKQDYGKINKLMLAILDRYSELIFENT